MRTGVKQGNVIEQQRFNRAHPYFLAPLMKKQDKS